MSATSPNTLANAVNASTVVSTAALLPSLPLQVTPGGPAAFGIDETGRAWIWNGANYVLAGTGGGGGTGNIDGGSSGSTEGSALDGGSSSSSP